jgi:hypothetical protein
MFSRASDRVERLLLLRFCPLVVIIDHTHDEPATSVMCDSAQRAGPPTGAREQRFRQAPKSPHLASEAERRAVRARASNTKMVRYEISATATERTGYNKQQTRREGCRGGVHKYKAKHATILAIGGPLATNCALNLGSQMHP